MRGTLQPSIIIHNLKATPTDFQNDPTPKEVTLRRGRHESSPWSIVDYDL